MSLCDDSNTRSVTPDPRLHGKDPGSIPGPGGSYPLLCHLLDTATVIEYLWSARVRPKLRNLLASSIGVDEATAGRVLSLIGGLHDVGKLNPYFQYQERYGAASEFAGELQKSTGLPASPDAVRRELNSNLQHPLRRHELLSHRAITHRWAAAECAIRGNEWAAIIAGGHHGYWRDLNPSNLWIGEPRGLGDRLINGWCEQQDSLIELVESAVGMTVAEIPELDGPRASAVFVCFSGLLTLADWLASDDARVDAGKQLWASIAKGVSDPYSSTEGARGWMDLRRSELREHIEFALGPDTPIDRGVFSDAVVGDFDPRPLQQEAIDLSGETDPGLWICMYPTGDGKTEAALLRGAVEASDGFFFGLPTLATTDAMEARLARIADRLPTGTKLPLRKSHQFASLFEAEGEPAASDRSDDEACDHSNPTWYTSAIRKLVSPNVVGTIDQALVGALAQRHITLRLFGLANHHIILDEVHTYDVYQTELLVELLYWWGLTETRVTLLSATLAATHLRCMVQAYAAGLRSVSFDSLADEVASLEAPFPSTVRVGRDGVTSVVLPSGPVRCPPPTTVDLVGISDREARIESHARWIVETARAHPESPIAVVSNVVADCAAIAARVVESSVGDTHETLCLHSALVAAHRAAVESRLLERAGFAAHVQGFGNELKPVIVVGTQIIQASLDFDVDFIASDLAPAPDLLQRLGRSWRFEGLLGSEIRGGRLAPGARRALRVVSVLGADGSPTRSGAVPYLAAVLRRTHAALAEQLKQSPIIDVLEFSQIWVDFAYDRDPFALISEDEREAFDATTEEVAASRQRRSASISRAQLARTGAGGSIALLPGPEIGWGSAPENRPFEPKWRDLVGLTNRADDEDLMRTRYIEQESTAVLLFDSTGESTFYDPRTGSAEKIGLPCSVDHLTSISSGAASHLLARSRFVIPSHLNDAAEAAVEATLAGRQWAPRAKALAATRPLDLRHLAGVARYHPLTGLMKEGK